MKRPFFGNWQKGYVRTFGNNYTFPFLIGSAIAIVIRRYVLSS